MLSRPRRRRVIAMLSRAPHAGSRLAPRKRFDEHFEDVQGCFIAALEFLTERALGWAALAGAAARTWPGGLHRALCSRYASIAAEHEAMRDGANLSLAS